jgi:serine/threonine protein phosphatase PrpC
MLNFYGSSIIGTSHKANKKPNQDYFLVRNRKKTAFAVVCDGLGSKKYSHYGSRLLSRLLKAFCIFFSEDLNRVRIVITIVSFLWRLLTFLFGSSNFDSTCQFILAKGKYLVIGQLGDGLITISKNDSLTFYESKLDLFINETNSIFRSKPKDWQFKVVNINQNESLSLSIMTDGISNDIVKANYKNFLKEIIINLSELASLEKKELFLHALLQSLPNKHNRDDKTFIIGF